MPRCPLCFRTHQDKVHACPPKHEIAADLLRADVRCEYCGRDLTGKLRPAFKNGIFCSLACQLEHDQ
jgi:hypothetical protein